MSWQFARAVHALLTSGKCSSRWTKRTRDTVEELRVKYELLQPEADVVVANRENRDVCWFTFAGRMINTVFSDVLKGSGFNDVVISDFWIRADGTTDSRRMVEAVQSKEADDIRASFLIGREFIDNLKFNECLPMDMAHEMLAERMLNLEELGFARAREVRRITE